MRKRIEKIDYHTEEFKCGFCGKWNELGDDCPCTIKREEKEEMTWEEYLEKELSKGGEKLMC